MSLRDDRNRGNAMSLSWLRGITEWEREQGPVSRALERCPRKLVSAVAMATALFTRSNADGSRVYPGARRVAADAGIGTTAVVAFRRRWSRAGWLTQVGKRRGGTPEYRLTIPVHAGGACESIERLSGQHAPAHRGTSEEQSSALDRFMLRRPLSPPKS